MARDSLVHNAQSVPVESIIGHDELTDLRAYQRTFDGAYARTALGQLSYAILILRLFERDFYWCGLVYTVLAVQLIVIGVYRYNLALSNESRWKDVSMAPVNEDSTVVAPSSSSSGAPGANTTATEQSVVVPAGHVVHQQLFRPTFRTAGTVVALATFGTLLLEIALVVLVIRM